MTRATAIVGLWTSVGLGLGPVAHADAHAVLVGVADYPEQTGWSPTETRDGPEVMAQLLRARGWTRGGSASSGQSGGDLGDDLAGGRGARERPPGDRVVFITAMAARSSTRAATRWRGSMRSWCRDADPDGVERQFDYVTDDELGARRWPSGGAWPEGDPSSSWTLAARAAPRGGTIQAMGAPQLHPVLLLGGVLSRRTGRRAIEPGRLKIAPTTVRPPPVPTSPPGDDRWDGPADGRLHGVPDSRPRVGRGAAHLGRGPRGRGGGMEGFLRPHGVSIPEPQLTGRGIGPP